MSGGRGERWRAAERTVKSSNDRVRIDLGSPPLSTPYVLSGKTACWAARYMSESGDEYTPFISLYTTPLYLESEGEGEPAGGGSVSPRAEGAAPDTAAAAAARGTHVSGESLSSSS